MLSDLIPTLESEGFACYWPGADGNIWRITKCLLDHYHVHVWSNVACINRWIDNTLENEVFACYRPGTDGNIWRITKCLLDHYHVHLWSNVACINRRIDEVRSIAQKMESMCLDTLEKGNDAVMELNLSDHK
jgi:hypothetical protein